ncbi:MAG: hypothetical protein EOO60_11500 [Hymenobacter sp.]|nr:MAG: hypothetical protein EOO60_11500 [Hymenobacter sp.]
MAKMHGTYLAELKHQPAAAEQAFERFSGYLYALKEVCKSDELVNDFQWNLGTPQALGITQAGSVGQDPITYLQEPVRPKTMLFEVYYTCAFNAFFDYQLRQLQAAQVPEAKLVQLLDSVTFLEAAFPDRYAGTRSYALKVEALNRAEQYLPNLVWMKALVNRPRPLGSARQQRNQLLLTISAALQDSVKMQHLRLRPDVLAFVKQIPQQPAFCRLPLQMLFLDLAVALAQTGRVAEAFALADLLRTPLATTTKIRLGERLMLTNNTSHQARLDGFLAQYCQQMNARPLLAAGSSIAVLCWRPYTDRSQDTAFYKVAGLLIRESNDFVRATGVRSMCEGYTLADKSHQAVQEIPNYQSERLRQPYFNTILAALAHQHTTSEGWYEYDNHLLERKDI